jgi:RND family efflux transporter MFP subunit
MRKTTIFLICAVLIVIAVIANIIIVKTAPKAERKRPPKTAALVEARALEAADETVILKLTGIVTPAEEIRLQARVTGEIISMNPEFIDGGLLKKGDEILRIDAVDYELAMADAASKLESALFEYKTELGRQEVAKREWELLKTEDASDLEKELALRKPHLAAKKASVESAEAALKRASINLERTRVSSPFNAVVTRRSINVGSQAMPQADLGTLAGTDAYWVTVSIPVDRLHWVKIPGSPAKIISNGGAVREGIVIKLLGDLEEKGRMARLLIEVRDPLALRAENSGAKPLLLGEYIRAEVEGTELHEVYTIPRSALRENDTIWIAADGKLDIRPVEVLWRDADLVMVRDGIAAGEKLITSDLTAPIQGMDVATGEKKNPGGKPANEKPAEKE